MSEPQKDHTLQLAIAQLPKYEAPEMVWDQIATQLEIDHKDALIKSASTRLGHLKAPEGLWDNIADAIDIPEEPIVKPGRVIPIWLRWTAAASLILCIGYWVSNFSTHAKASYAETMEIQDMYLLQNDWDSDEAVFAEVVSLHDQYMQVFQDRESTQLKEELEELDNARKELKEAIDLYGNDHELIRQLANLERDRTEVIKQMANKI